MINRIKVPLSDLKYIQSEIEKILNLEKNTNPTNGNEMKATKNRLMRSTKSSLSKTFAGRETERRGAKLY
jgi:hypothetical protein